MSGDLFSGLHISNGRALTEPEWPADDPGPTEPPDDDGGGYSPEGAIRHRMASLRVDREARRRLDDESRPPQQPPDVKALPVLLAEPDTAAAYRIDQLAPEGGRVMLSAQYKAGKSTAVGNLLRALADREPFLDRFAINDPPRSIVLIDTELSANTLRRWLRAQGITNPAAIGDVVALRGTVGAFNLLDDRRRADWAARLRDVGCDYLILDCLRPVLDALGLDEHRDVGRLLVAFDALLADANIPDALVVQHMGHSGERARGDSRLQDWPDATWRIVREDDNPASPRFFSAYGRDVDVPEGRLSFDAATRHLAYAAGSRTDIKTEAAAADVIAILAESTDSLSGRAIELALTGSHAQKAIRAAIAATVDHGLVKVTEGPRRAKLHALAHPCSECGMPVASGGERHQSCPAGAEGLFP